MVAQLQKNSCSLSQKEISTILYYFDENFRASMEYSISQKSNQSNEAPSRLEVERACASLNFCYYVAGTFRGDVMTDCREKMLTWYNNGYLKKSNTQRVKLAQLGADKYRNTSLEDSPYDLLYDISAIAKIFFEDVQEPYQLAFYHMPVISKP